MSMEGADKNHEFYASMMTIRMKILFGELTWRDYIYWYKYKYIDKIQPVKIPEEDIKKLLQTGQFIRKKQNSTTMSPGYLKSLSYSQRI